jgi:tetratricopeptide (TPR) repeat protein
MKEKFIKPIDFSYFIERYNSGEMNEAELTWFRKELDGNEELRREVELRKKADMVLKNHDVIQLRSKLSDIESKRAAEEPVKTRIKRIPLGYAAAIAGFILVSSIFLFNGRNLTSDEILDRFYKSYEVTSPSRSQQAILNSDYSTAIEFYNIRDYRNAALYFSKVLSEDPKYMESTMLYGVSNFEIKDYTEAKQSFMKVIDDNDNLFLEDAKWYLALCYLKIQEPEKAADMLDQIKRSESIYKKDAALIMRKMK